MHETLGAITLRDGEAVDLCIVRAPDADWRERLVTTFVGKGALWQWQVDQSLASATGMDAAYFLLKRGGQPFANVMTALVDGVGILGHVWTRPEDRGKGASSLLMAAALDDFATQGGRALFLETGYGSTVYRIYQRNGFRSLEAGSGYMAYYRLPQPDFDHAYFASGAVTIQPLAWRHWPTSQALFGGDWPGLVRCAGLQLVGRSTNDEYLIPLLHEELRSSDDSRRARVLVSASSGAVVGFALWTPHPFWPGLCVIDVYCHPNFGQHADDLLSALTVPDKRRWVAYADPDDTAKMALLRAWGFAPTVTLPERIGTVGVRVFEKTGSFAHP